MKKMIIAACLSLAAAGSLDAQSSFLIGGRYSNYSTDVTTSSLDLETGRQSSLGFLGEFRSQQLVLKGSAENDFGDGISVTDLLPFDLEDYSRQRMEFSVGYSPIDMLDLDAGVRLDTFEIQNNVFGNEFLDGDDISHQALAFGINLHSRSIRPIGFYVAARGYVGSADLDIAGTSPSIDTTGYRFEAGLPIAAGMSGWEVTPGFEVEKIELDEERYALEIDTNRFFINFAYSWGR